LRKAQRMQVHLPPGGRVSTRRLPEDLREAFAAKLYLLGGPFIVRTCDTILPSRVIPAVQSHFEAFVADMAHDVAGAAPDVGTGEQRAVEPRLHAVVFNDRSALHLAHESWAEYAPDGAACAIRSDAEKERRAGVVRFEQLDELRHAFARSA